MSSNDAVAVFGLIETIRELHKVFIAYNYRNELWADKGWRGCFVHMAAAQKL